MRTRYKIVILLFTATLGLGTFILLYSSDDALHRFRLLLFKDPVRLLAEVMLSFGNLDGLGYGAITFLAIIIIGLAVKMARDGELRAFSDRLVKLEVAKAELESLLQDSMWKEKHARAAKDAALKDLEANLGRLVAAELQVVENDTLLQIRNGELQALRSQAGTLTGRREESVLKDELRRKSDLLEATASEINQLEKTLTGKVHAFETQLNIKEKMLKERDVELEALKAQLAKSGTAKSQAESFLSEELRKLKQASESKDSAMKELEKSLTAKLHVVNVQLIEKQELLQVRSTAMDALRADVNALTGQLADAAFAKTRAENLLQQELKTKTALLQSKDAAFKELQESLAARIGDLEQQLSRNEAAFEDRNAELEALKAQLTKSGTAKSQAESFLSEELRKLKQASESKDSAMKELEKNLTVKLHVLNVQLIDKQELLQVRSTEMEALKADVNALTGQLAEAASAKTRAENLLQQELENKIELLQSKDAAFKELQESLAGRIHDLEQQLRENERSLKDRDAELEALSTRLAKMTPADQEREDLLREQLNKTKDVLEAKNSTIRELEGSLKQTIGALQNEASEHEALLKRRDTELQALRSEASALKAQLTRMSSVTAGTEGRGEEEISNASTGTKLDESSKRVWVLENLLSEKEDQLKIHDEKIERLESELKEKRTELARHEIAVWQSIERRDLWKRRLAKFGIPLKER